MTRLTGADSSSPKQLLPRTRHCSGPEFGRQVRRPQAAAAKSLACKRPPAHGQHTDCPNRSSSCLLYLFPEYTTRPAADARRWPGAPGPGSAAAAAQAATGLRLGRSNPHCLTVMIRNLPTMLIGARESQLRPSLYSSGPPGPAANFNGNLNLYHWQVAGIYGRNLHSQISSCRTIISVANSTLIIHFSMINKVSLKCSS